MPMSAAISSPRSDFEEPGVQIRHPTGAPKSVIRPKRILNLAVSLWLQGKYSLPRKIVGIAETDGVRLSQLVPAERKPLKFQVLTERARRQLLILPLAANSTAWQISMDSLNSPRKVVRGLG